MTKLHKKLKDIREKKQQCKFFLKMDKEEYTLHGYILDINEDFIYIHNVIDFTVDGYRIFKLENLKKVRYNKFDKTCTKIYEAEGLTELIYTYEKINLESYQSIFKSIQKIYTYCIIESMYRDELAFNIGEITKAGKRNVSQLHFDGTGKLDEYVTEIPYSDIMIVGFDSHYLNVFQKYLK